MRHSTSRPRIPAVFITTVFVTTAFCALCLGSSVMAQPKGGATLYDSENFTGRYETFFDDQPRLDGTRIGSDRVSSVLVAPGCNVELFRDTEYRGPSEIFYGRQASLRDTRVGNDAASSLRIDCGRLGQDPQEGRLEDRRDDRRDARSNQGRFGDQGVSRQVELFEDPGFRGHRTVVTDDLDSLQRTEVGNDRVSSIRVPPGCDVRLFADADFRGASLDIDRDESDLDRTQFGSDRLSSIEVDCRGDQRGDRRDERWRDQRERGEPWGAERWQDRDATQVIVYADAGFRGRSETLTQDDDDLSNNRIGSDSISSVRVPAGCQVTLFDDIRFKGASAVLERDAPSLEGTRVGNDRATSLTVRCVATAGPDFGWGSGVVLYGDSDFRGAQQRFDRDASDLRASGVGNDRASSVRVAPGCIATLYRDVNFRGESVSIESDVEDLSRTRVGSDSVSSLQVECRRRR